MTDKELKESLDAYSSSPDGVRKKIDYYQSEIDFHECRFESWMKYKTYDLASIFLLNSIKNRITKIKLQHC